MLARLVSYRESGNMMPAAADPSDPTSGTLLLDRDPVPFQALLSYLRHGTLDPLYCERAGVMAIRREADYFGLHKLLVLLDSYRVPDFRRADVIRASSRENRNFAGASLQRQDLSELTLKVFKFQRTDLRGASLRNAVIRPSCVFQDTTLAEADLSGVTASSCAFVRCDFRGCSLRGADLRGAVLAECHLDESDCTGANFEQAVFHGSTLVRCSLRDCNLGYSKMQGVDLREADLGGASLIDSHLGLADLRLASLDWALDHNVGDISWKNFLTGSKVTQSQWDAIPCPLAEKERFFLTICDDLSGEVIKLGAESWDRHHHRQSSTTTNTPLARAE